MKNILVTLIIFLTTYVAAEDIVTIEATISGNSELPKVMTIVPWKQPKYPEYLGEEVNGIGEAIDVFQIIDRDSFNRERLYISSARKTITK